MSEVTAPSGNVNWGSVQDLLQAGQTKKLEPSGSDRLANKEVFLQLLVAQLKNQNPLDPADGVEFVAQLAQFTQLEQTMGMREELKTIRENLAGTPGEGVEQP